MPLTSGILYYSIEKLVGRVKGTTGIVLFIPSPEFASRDIELLEIFAVEYNEDLPAFHGPTLDV